MRTARLVGLSSDGRSLIVATDSGEQLAIPADERLRAAVRGDRPRLGQLEIEMEPTLSPRDIQSRIRAGASLEDVATVAGIPIDRVERFAAPVLAEREYIAAQAMSSSVRRRGETSGHRNLRVTLTERLLGRGVDLDTLVWDSFRREDGRWSVTADYRSGDAERQAQFFFDVGGRFSVAANDEARWILGETSPAKGPQPGRRRPEGSAEGEDVEPTLDLSDELAIVRAVQEPPPAPPAALAEAERLASVQPLRAVPAAEPEPRPAAELAPEAPAEPEPVDEEDEAAEEPSALDTLYDILEGRDFAEESPRAYEGLSDASAVPESAVRSGAGWEPAIVVNYPVEPSQVERKSDDTSTPGEETPQGTDEPGRPDAPTALEDREDEADALEEEHEAPAEGEGEPQTPAPAKSGRRKRASVPSWDEIMFGAPKRP